MMIGQTAAARGYTCAYMLAVGAVLEASLARPMPPDTALTYKVVLHPIYEVSSSHPIVKNQFHPRPFSQVNSIPLLNRTLTSSYYHAYGGLPVKPRGYPT